jgi:YHS domain-containing protein
VFALISPASAANLVNADDGLALQGYDPVSFFLASGPQSGSQAVTADHHGATYHFVSEANRETFQADPDKYAPAFGGYCAYGVSVGSLFPVEIDTWQIIDGQLVLNKNLKVKRLFDKNRERNFAKANKKWPSLVKKKGR